MMGEHGRRLADGLTPTDSGEDHHGHEQPDEQHGDEDADGFEDVLAEALHPIDPRQP
jgi:hypothetical protein